MTEQLDLSLPKREQPPARLPGKGLYAVGVLLLAAVLVNIWLTARGGGSISGVQGKGGTLPADGLKQLALKLEERGLNAEAVDTWKEYLPAAGAKDDESAQIWYRVGTLRQDDRDYAGALNAYYRSESFGSIPGLASEIARRSQECLEAMGRFSALGNELNGRVNLAATSNAAGGDVVAEIGPQKITRADLDRRIEALVDRQLSGLYANMPDDERNKRKDEMLKHLSSQSQRLELLNGMVMEEILYRRAGELKLGDDPAVRESLRDIERGRLAQEVVERELAGGIKITDGDLTTWYEAHKSDYVETQDGKPERQKTFDEVRSDVYRQLRSSKEREVQTKLLSDLRERYSVVIHQSAFPSADKQKEE